MAPKRVGILPQEDRMAIIQGAKRLGLDPYEFGAFLSLESGMNMDPNIVGGAGGRHKGLIQFGANEQRMYGITGQQTRAGQMPKVLQYFSDRGYKPGMGIARAYATVLGGNPNVSLNSKDSFGTSVAGVLPRFRKGGDLYSNAQRVLGDIPSDFAAPQQVASAPVASTVSQLSDASGLSIEALTTALRKRKSTSLLDAFKSNVMQQLIENTMSGGMNFLSSPLFGSGGGLF
jgi:hypothetical protein